MCKPTAATTQTGSSGTKERKRVVVSGAGPAGLLLASLLLNKNKEESCAVTYDVTLLDGREDYGSFTREELSSKHRSWMLGLADHGMDAIKKLPELYENYVRGEGILVRELAIYLGSKKMAQTTDSYEVASKIKASSASSSSSSSPSEENDKQDQKASAAPEAFIVDRNFIVAALARYIRETHENDPNYTALYQTKCQYVDYDRRRVLVRSVGGANADVDAETETETDAKNDEYYIDYDLLVGCDGVRSTVREALVKRHSDFSLEYTDIFQEFKQVHVKLPESVSQSAMALLPDVFPCMQGIALPETGGMLNISAGCPRNLFAELPAELKSDDASVVSAYVRANFKAFELVDWDDFGRQWAGQRWNQTGMVHCNFYHSLKAGVVLMGDAAHATSPSIGMGMNTALRDAQVFSEILEDTGDDFEAALPAFSEARVREGNALSDLAMHLYSMDKTQQFLETIHLIVRTFLHTKFPGLVREHPQAMIGRRGVPLSEVYERSVELGILRRHRKTNDRIRLEYFEQTAGMITRTKQPTTTTTIGMLSKLLVVGAGLAAIGAVAYRYCATV